jgi:CubicO group peptidase (beta-lactamase class C family)
LGFSALKVKPATEYGQNVENTIMLRTLLPILVLVILFACSKAPVLDPDPPPPPPPPPPPIDTPGYFPPLSGDTWETTNISSPGWNATALNDLFTYLESKHTKAFIVIRNGRIVTEKYFGTFTMDSIWYWASAGKTMTSLLIGIAQKEGLLSISDRTSKYLGNGWTSLPQEKEDLITIRNQLSMTTGLDDAGPSDPDCSSPDCLTYKADAGARWAYHNAPYTILDKVIQSASGKSYNAYFQEKIRDRIGMKGLWVPVGYNNVYYSNARSMARFGLLLLNKGKWDQTMILSDTTYFADQTTSSQNINLSYGYLTWLNGKASYMLPTLQNIFNGPMVPNAPAEMFSALGKNDQKIYVIPSQKLVIIRMGESAGNVELAQSSFDNELWGKLKAMIGY